MLLSAASLDGMLRTRDATTAPAQHRSAMLVQAHATFGKTPGHLYDVVIERLAEAVVVLSTLTSTEDDPAAAAVLNLMASAGPLLSTGPSAMEDGGPASDSGPEMFDLARHNVRSAMASLDAIGGMDPRPERKAGNDATIGAGNRADTTRSPEFRVEQRGEHACN